MMASSSEDQDVGQAPTFDNLIEDSSMCLLLLSLWLCICGVMLRTLFEECRLERKFSPAGFLATCLLVAVGGAWSAALAFYSYQARVDLIYIGYVYTFMYSLTLVALVGIVLEYVWWRLWNYPKNGEWDKLNYSIDSPTAAAGLIKNNSFSMRWVTSWLKTGIQADRSSYKPVRQSNLEFSKRSLEEAVQPQEFGSCLDEVSKSKTTTEVHCQQPELK